MLPDGDRRFGWPGQLPEGVTEAMLSPVETREQEIQAAQEDNLAMMHDLIRQYGDKKEERGGT
jgi:hypothetical protein